MFNLNLLCGIPGSGKTTFAKTILSDSWYVSSDDIRRELAGSLKEAFDNDIKPWDIFYQSIRDGLLDCINVTADATFLIKDHRMRAKAIADECGAKTNLIIFRNVFDAFERNDTREEDRVPENTMEYFQDLLDQLLVEIKKECYHTVTIIEKFI